MNTHYSVYILSQHNYPCNHQKTFISSCDLRIENVKIKLMRKFNKLGSEVTDGGEFNTDIWENIIIVRDAPLETGQRIKRLKYFLKVKEELC